METLTQRVLIPENHQISLTLPPNIPPGEAEIVLVINTKEVKRRHHEDFMKLAGALKDSPNFGGNHDPVQIQRQLRAEWEG